MLFAWIVFVQILSLKYEGMKLSREYIKMVTGVFTREFKYVRYDKVQYMELKQGSIMRKLRITKGELHVLASVVTDMYLLMRLRC